MTQQLLKTISLALALTAGAAQADPVLLTSVSHAYGSGTEQSRVYTANTCVQAGAVSVYDNTSCGNGQRFYDAFGLSGIGAADVSSIQLTLSFSATNDRYLAVFLEDWRVRPASSGTSLSDYYLQNDAKLTRSGSTVTQTFNFTAANLDLFSAIVDGQMFGLAFSEQAVGTNFFNLYSAKVDVYGTDPALIATVPEPSALALVGLALFGLGLSRRRSMR